MSEPEDFVICRICGGEFPRIHWSHLARKHQMTFEEYKVKFPDAPTISRKSTKKMSEFMKEQWQWHSLSPDEVLRMFNSRCSGLTESEAKTRWLQYGPNKLKGKKKPPPILAFLKQFLSPLIYVLLAAVVVSVIMEHLQFV